MKRNEITYVEDARTLHCTVDFTIPDGRSDLHDVLSGVVMEQLAQHSFPSMYPGKYRLTLIAVVTENEAETPER